MKHHLQQLVIFLTLSLFTLSAFFLSSTCNNSYPNDDVITPPIDTTNYTEHTIVFITHVEDNYTEISIWEIDKHEYIIAKSVANGSSISMIHSENCSCKHAPRF